MGVTQTFCSCALRGPEANSGVLSVFQLRCSHRESQSHVSKYVLALFLTFDVVPFVALDLLESQFALAVLFESKTTWAQGKSCAGE